MHWTSTNGIGILEKPVVKAFGAVFVLDALKDGVRARDLRDRHTCSVTGGGANNWPTLTVFG